MSRSEVYQQLELFVGKWQTEGKIRATENTPEINITGTDSYQWLAGKFFLVHKVDVFVGNEKNDTLEIIGFDSQINKYTMQYYDNKGNTGTMIASYNSGTWTFLGDHLRFTGGFINDNKEFSGVWEQSTKGENWEHFMDIRLKKIEGYRN